MRAVLIATVLLLAAAPVFAARPSAADMSCAEAQALVSARGAVVIGTGRYTYKRFVSNVGFCIHGEVTEPAWATTKDGRRCRIGDACMTKFYRFRD